MAKRGRPSSYKPEYAEQAEKLAALGATDREIADFLEVSEPTIYRWQAEFPEFCKSLKAGKEPADERVVRSLYRRALGYSHDATKVFMHEGAPVYAPFVEHYAPDTTAAIFWLKNRRPDLWRDRVEHTGAEGGPIQIEDKAGIEAARRIAFMLMTNAASPVETITQGEPE